MECFFLAKLIEFVISAGRGEMMGFGAILSENELEQPDEFHRQCNADESQSSN